MNTTQYGNTAIGEVGSLARAQANEKFLSQELANAIYALNELRDRYTPNDPNRREVALADRILEKHNRLMSSATATGEGELW